MNKCMGACVVCTTRERNQLDAMRFSCTTHDWSVEFRLRVRLRYHITHLSSHISHETHQPRATPHQHINKSLSHGGAIGIAIGCM